MYPILFEFETLDITIFSLWLFIAIGFVTASFIFVRLAKRQRLQLGVLADTAVILFLWTLLISRLTFIITHTDLYFGDGAGGLISTLKLWDKGLSFWGAAFGWVIGICYLLRRYEDRVIFFDTMAPALLYGMAVGHIGALLDGINYGIPTSLPWGIRFETARVKYVTEIHPTQLYAFLYCIIIGTLLIVLFKKIGKRLPGLVTEVGITLFGFAKFLEEFFRGDEAIKIFSIRVPQIIAFIAFLVGSWLMYRRYKNTVGGDPTFLIKNFIGSLIKKLMGRFSAVNQSTLP